MRHALLATLLVSALALGGCQETHNTGSAGRTDSNTVGTFNTVRAEPSATRAVAHIKNLSCPLCLQDVRKELRELDGVESIDINYREEYATLKLSSRKPPTRAQIEEAIARSGHTLTRLDMR